MMTQIVQQFSAEDVQQLFSLDLALASQRRGFEHLGRGEAVLAPRILVPGQGEDVAFCYAARLEPEGSAVSKFGSVNPGNAARGLPTISATIHVLHPITGLPSVQIDGESVTTLRTAAASALAVQALARVDATVLGVIGSGIQAEAHLRSIANAVPLERMLLASRNRSTAKSLAARLEDELGLEILLVDAQEAASADIVVTCTTSSVPVIEADWVMDGALVVSVGSFAPDRHELPQNLLKRAARIVVDHRQTALEHAGPVQRAVESGLIEDIAAIGQLGDILIGAGSGRRHASEIIIYNSVGIGIQDAAAAIAIMDESSRRSRVGSASSSTS